METQKQVFAKFQTWSKKNGLTKEVKKLVSADSKTPFMDIEFTESQMAEAIKQGQASAKKLGFVGLDDMMGSKSVLSHKQKEVIKNSWAGAGYELSESGKKSMAGEESKESESKSEAGDKSKKSDYKSMEVESDSPDRKVGILNEYLGSHADKVNSLLGTNLSQQQIQKKIKSGGILSSQGQLQDIMENLSNKGEEQKIQVLEEIIEAGGFKHKPRESFFDTRSIKSEKIRKKIDQMLDKQLVKYEKQAASEKPQPQAASSLQNYNNKNVDYVPVGIIQYSRAQQMKRWNDMLNNPVKYEASATEKEKIAYLEQVKKNDQQGANLAVVKNDVGIETYSVRYPTVQEMLNLPITRQFAFDVAQRKHLTLTQNALVQNIIDKEITYMPNSQFLREKYEHTKLPEDLELYNKALVNQLGKEVAYYGQSDFKELKPINTDSKDKASKNTAAAPAMSSGLKKPKMIQTREITNGIYEIIDYVSKLSGNLNKPELWSYAKVTDVFAPGIVEKREPTSFKPLPGQGFKIRELQC